MNYRAIINACSPAYQGRAEEVACFIESHLPGMDSAARDGKAVVFYAAGQAAPGIIAALPFKTISLVKIAHYQPELILNILEELECSNPSEMYIFPGDFSGSELAARFARRAKGSSLAAVEQIRFDDNRLLGIKNVYSGNLRGTFLFRNKPYCFSLARGMGRLEAAIPAEQKTITYLDYSTESPGRHLVDYEETPGEKEDRLEKAGFIIAAGRGAGNSEEISRLNNVARTLGAELGVSRPVVMNAWSPLDRLIGASGAVVAPEVCLALAVSGAPPFYYGIEKSKKIIAVNHDEHAPILKGADVVIVDDYRKVIDALYDLAAKETGA